MDLTEDKLGLGDELVFRHLQVERRRSTPDTTRAVVVAAVARAVPPIVVTGVRDWNAAQVRAHTENNEPAECESVVAGG